MSGDARVHELILMRHAKSDWSDDRLADFDRPLNSRGAGDAVRIGQWLGHLGAPPERIVSSPAVRARQTVEALCRAAGIDPASVIFEDDVYLASAPTLLAVLGRHALACRTLMMVGHNPGFDDLLQLLCDPDTLPRTDAGKLMTTAAVARIELSLAGTPPRPVDGRLLELVRPKDLD